MANKILFIIQRYHPAKGGAELFIKTLAEYLANSEKYSVDVWTTDAFNTGTLWDLDDDVIEKKVEKIENVNVKRFQIGKGILRNKYLNKIFRVVFGSLPFFKISNLATCPTTFGMLDEIKKIEGYKAVIVSTTPYYFLFYVGYLISKKLNIPLVVIPALHTGVEENDTLKKKYLRKSAIPFFEHATKIILNTKTEGEAIERFCEENGTKIDKSKFVVMGQGIFWDKIKGGNGEEFRNRYGIKNKIVFQVGSKSYEKGSISLINAMINCWEHGVDATLVFGGGYDKDFNEYIDKLDPKYRGQILNIDNISDEEKWDLFDAGDVFSMVSKTDSFGIVYLEAWAYGKPVLACDNKAIREVVSDKEDGYLLPFDDIEKISEKIIYLLNYSEKRNEMGKSGKRKVEEKYDWDKNLKKFGTMFKNL